MALGTLTILLLSLGLVRAAAPSLAQSAVPFIGPPAPWGPVAMLGRELVPGALWRSVLPAGESFAGAAIDIPVLAMRGASDGPTVCLTAGVHGDELNGVEIVRQVFDQVDPAQLQGMVIGLPVVNLHGFRSSSRYLPDRRDLNRYFPGASRGSSAARIAHAIFQFLTEHCDYLVDFHTASFHRTNLPQLRADLRDPRVVDLARRFDAGVLLHSLGMRGTLRRAATTAGLPTITYEAGEPMRFERAEIDHGVNGVRNLLGSLRMIEGFRDVDPNPEIYRRSAWVRSNDGGIFLTDRTVGDRVERGDLLGQVIDPVSNERTDLTAPFAGRIIGMALPQVVIPGFATFHLGIAGDDRDLHADAEDPPHLVEQPE